MKTGNALYCELLTNAVMNPCYELQMLRQLKQALTKTVIYHRLKPMA